MSYAGKDFITTRLNATEEVRHVESKCKRGPRLGVGVIGSFLKEDI